MDVIVGTEDCPITKIHAVIGSNLAVRENWATFASWLEIPSDSIKKSRTDLLLNKITYQDVITNILEEWIGLKGSDAKLFCVITALKHCGAGGVGNRLLESLKLSVEETEYLLGKNQGPVVGSIECPLNQIYRIIRFDYNLHTKWSVFGVELGIPYERIKTFRDDMLLDKIGKEDAIHEIVELWVAKEGMKATLCELIRVLEDCCASYKSGDLLRLAYNLPCMGSDKPSISWNDLSIGFQNKVEQSASQFWPNIKLIENISGKYIKNKSVDMFAEISKEKIRLQFLEDITSCSQNLQKNVCHDVLKSNLHGDVLIDLMMGKRPNVLVSRITQNISYYITRSLLTRNVISKEIFEADNTDIYLFNGIEKHELAHLTGRQGSSATSEQVESSSITARFMSLDQPNDFEEICKKTNNSVHLIQYFSGKMTWTRSNGNIGLLQEFISKAQDEVEESCLVLNQDHPTQPVCLSDSPGMGKSILLAHIAKALDNAGENDVVFLHMNELLSEMKMIGSYDKASAEKTLSKLVCNNILSETVFQSKLSSPHKQIELLLDAFDVIDSEDQNTALEILSALKDIKSIRLWVTTRPHFLPILEKCLGVFGYNIKPFSDENQINFLTKYWHQQSNNKNIIVDKLAQYGEKALITVKQNMGFNEADFCGVPLQCLLIAEVFEKSALDFAKPFTHLITFPKLRFSSIADLYTHTVEKKFKKFKEVHGSEKKRDENIMFLGHVRLSLKMIFPNYFGSVHPSLPELLDFEIRSIGLIESSNIKAHPQFIHRTFAEYFIARYVAEIMNTGEAWNSKFAKFLLENVLKSETINVPVIDEVINSFRFKFNTVCYFTNFLLCPKRLNSQTILADNCHPLYIRYISHSCANANFLQILKYFFNYNIFSNSSLDIDICVVATRNASFEFVKYLLDRVTKFFNLGEKLLRLSIYRGHFSIFNYLAVQQNISASVKELTGQTKLLLHDCVKDTKYLTDELIQDKVQILRSLLAINKLLLEQKDESGNTPLLCKYAHVSLLMQLIEEGGNVYAQDIKGNTFLHMTFNSLERRYSNDEYHQILNKLVSSNKLGGLVQVKGEDGDSLLCNLLWHNDPSLEILQIFNNAGPVFNVKNNESFSPLTIAIRRRRNLNTLRTLIEFGSDLSWEGKYGQTLLHEAAFSGHVDGIILLIMEFKFEVNCQDKNGHTPLEWCLRANEIDKSSKQLYTAGIKLHQLGARLDKTKETYDRMLCDAINGGHEHSVVLLQHLKDCTCHHQRECNCTCKSLNLSNNSVGLQQIFTPKIENNLGEEIFSKMIQKFVETGGKSNYSDKDGNSLLHIAVTKGDEQAVRNLAVVLNPNSFNRHKQTALHMICDTENLSKGLDMAAVLIDLGASAFLRDDIGDTFLQTLIKRGNILTSDEIHQVVVFAVANGISRLFNVHDGVGVTPLHWACNYIAIEKRTLILLRDAGVDFNSTDQDGHSLITYVLYGKTDATLIADLVEFGLNLKHIDNDLNNYLHIASEVGNLDAVKYLLNSGQLNVNERNKFQDTPLHRLLRFGDKNALEISMSLIESGADLSVEDADGNTPLNLATKLGHNVNLTSLLTSGNESSAASESSNPNTANNIQLPLHAAVDSFLDRSKCIKSIKNLIDDGVDSSSKDGKAETFLHKLLRSPPFLLPSQLHDISDYLMQKDKLNLFNAVGGVQEDTPLHLAVENIEVEERTLLLLYSKNIKFNSVVKNGNSLVQYAIEGGRSPTFLSTLVKLGADIKSLNNMECSLLHFAGEFGNVEIMKYLIGLQQLDVNCRNKEGNTALNYTLQHCRENGVSLATLLIDNGADLTLRNNLGENPLHCIASNGDKVEIVEIIKLLIKDKCDPVAQEFQGHLTFLHMMFAKDHGRKIVTASEFHKIVEFLVDNSLAKLFDIPASSGATPLHLAVMEIELKKKTVQLLHSAGVNFNAKDNDKDSVLTYAILGKRRVKFISNLLYYGANLRHLGNNNCSYLHTASEVGSVRLLKHFLEMRALDVNGIDNDGDTPLHCAIQQKDAGDLLEKVLLLIQYKSKVNIPNKMNHTPLELVMIRHDIQKDTKIKLIELLKS